MRNLSMLASAVALASASAIAQTIILPDPGITGGFGTSANYVRAVPDRFSVMYDAANFLNQGIVGPVSITVVELEVSVAASAAIVTYPQIDCYVDYAAVDYTVMDLTFANNRANPAAPANFSGPATTTQTQWFLSLPLTTPFTYDPTLGIDLVIDFVIPTAPTPATANTSYCAYSATIPGNLCNVVRSPTSATATAGALSSWVPRTNLTMVPDPNAGTATPIGAGCQSKYASFYELFDTTANFDLLNGGVNFIYDSLNDRYTVSAGATYFPVGSFGTPVALTLADDSEQFIAFTTGAFKNWTGFSVGSNGWVAANTGNTTVAAPSANNQMNNPEEAFYSQRDLDPSSGGTVTVEETGAITVITFEGVPNWDNGGGAFPCDIQFQLYSSGDVFIAYGANMSPNQDNGGILVGYSPGGTSLVPPSTDISAMAGSFVTETADVYPMDLASVTRPVTGTNWQFAVDNIPALNQIGVEIYGFSDPGINDLFFIGAPGCGLRANTDVLNPWVSLGQTTHSFSLPLPNNGALLGVHLYIQAAMLNPVYNTFGVITSNGIDGQIGTV